MKASERYVTVRVSFWLSESEFIKMVNKIVDELEGKVNVKELRRILGIREEELTDDIEPIDIEKLRRKELDRVWQS